MGNVQIYSTGLVGLSFSIAELILVAGWAEAQGLQMSVCLDHGSENEEYEEVLAFHTTWGRPRRHILWRDHQAVYVQPLIGRTRRYSSVADALDALAPHRATALTDVMPTGWPA